ncbi:hypothetical protein LTR78_009179 [Recurvomyces mirabilis]|uniref:F-box domain-containing protein n=1 Tax=Recurvomyces mirabilis TaxID=574656 RepID=A0AAE0TS10_9PEZI|nr:hypothetical protein LTR78_009179 [Recurvomyces mirabilis]KAK5155661.1 hypothetical protein LTS14_005922 [Recurvomyces mirabilis]
MAHLLDLPAELHEQILLYLPLRSLLLARCVCLTFDRAILGSGKIQQALWLRPHSSLRMVWSPHPSRDGRPAWDTGDWGKDLEEGRQQQQQRQQREDHSGDKTGRASTWLIANPFIPASAECNAELFKRQWYGECFPEEPARIFGNPDSWALARRHYTIKPVSFDHRRYPCRFYIAGRIYSYSDAPTMNAFPRSCDRMLMTHPPMRSVSIKTRNQPRLVEASDDDGDVGGITPEHLAVASLSEVKRGADVSIIGGEKWRLLRKTVDEITGWEMLDILLGDMDEDDGDVFVLTYAR